MLPTGFRNLGFKNGPVAIYGGTHTHSVDQNMKEVVEGIGKWS
jgi:hypothetical protein